MSVKTHALANLFGRDTATPVTVHTAMPYSIDARHVHVDVSLVSSSRPRLHDCSSSVDAYRWTETCGQVARDALTAAGFPQAASIRVRLSYSGDEVASAALAVALGAVAAHDVLPWSALADVMVLGALTPHGQIEPVRGVLPMLRCLQARGIATALLPRANVPEAHLLPGLSLLPADDLREAIQQLTRRHTVRTVPVTPASPARSARGTIGEPLAAVVAGGHPVLLVGGHGSGAALIARDLRHFLPPPSLRERFALTLRQSLKTSVSRLATDRPCEAPHCSVAADVLRGTVQRPGILLLADQGVLVLEDIDRFNAVALDAVVATVRSGELRVPDRLPGQTVSVPCAPLLVATTAACVCGWRGTANRRCHCNATDLARHYERVPRSIRAVFDVTLWVRTAPTRTGRRYSAADIAAARARIARDARPLTARCAAHVARFLDLVAAAYALSDEERGRIARLAGTLAHLRRQDTITAGMVHQALCWYLGAPESSLSWWARYAARPSSRPSRRFLVTVPEAMQQ